MEIRNWHVDGFEAAIRGMRNPMNSWDRSDSRCEDTDAGRFVIGEADMGLMQRLYRAGAEHRKYMRFINVSFDVTAPMYWWLEFDTYKVGTSKNSCSKMHRIHTEPFAMEDFEYDAIDDVGGLVKRTFERYITQLEDLRQDFNETQDRVYWRALIQMLPESYRMTATISTNYEVLDNMVRQRSGHKLAEWHRLVNFAMGLPYFAEITGRKIKED